MTLLRLSPDSERLRRIAKAHAAGELSTPDYRRIRAEVIERFSSGEAEELDDDTQPRWLDRPVRRRRRCSRATTDASVRRNDASGGGRLIVSVIVIAAVGSAAAWSSSIPPVKQRDPNPATSPRIPVDHLGVRNFVAYPDLGITEESVDAVLASRIEGSRRSVAAGAERIHRRRTRRGRHAAQVDGRESGTEVDRPRCRAVERVAGDAEIASRRVAGGARTGRRAADRRSIARMVCRWPPPICRRRTWRMPTCSSRCCPARLPTCA